MAALTILNEDEDGISLSGNLENVDSGGGDTALNPNGRLRLFVNNLDGSNSATVTITAQDTTTEDPRFGELTRDNISVTLNAGDYDWIGPIPKAFNNSSGQVAITYSGTGAASVDIAAVEGKS